MNITKFLKNKKWHKMGKWKEPIAVETAVIDFIVHKKFTSVFRVNPSVYVNIMHEQYFPKKEYKRYVEFAKKIFTKNPKKTFLKLKQDNLRTFAKTKKFPIKKLGSNEIKKFFTSVSCHARLWFEIMIIDAVLSELYPESLPKKFSLNKKPYTSQSLLTQSALPKKELPVRQEHDDLLKIAIKSKQGKNISSDLRKHVKKYSWMASLGIWNEPFTAEDYKKELSKLIAGDPKKELILRQKEKDRNYRKAAVLLSKLRKEFPQAWQIIDFIRELADLKEENWDTIATLGTVLRPSFKKLAAQYYLSYYQLMALMPAEILKLLKHNKLPVSLDAVNKRLKSYAILGFSKAENITLGGEQARKLLSLVRGKLPKVKELHGMSIWPGRVRGIAKILTSPDDVSKIEEGEILVCPMSDPDYMPAIKKARAIVADQGGVLCHAAVVARELQVPCVVGTEYATRLFKDSDLVEVDANSGIIRKIKQHEE